MELWFKQYLGLFFDFENYGILNWLTIPLLIYFIFTIKKRKRWEIAIVFVFFLSCLVLGSTKGSSNPRYILSLYPFTLAVIFLFGWEFIKNKKHYLRISILVICGSLVLFNYYHSRDIYKQYWRYKVTYKDYYFPHELIEFINNIEDLSPESAIFVCARSFFTSCYYYYSKKRGISFYYPWKRDLYYKKNKEEALDFLKNQLKIKYIYIDQGFIQSYQKSGILTAILIKNCELVYQWENILYFYRLHDRVPDKEEHKKLFINDSLLKNGSFENWAGGHLKYPDFFQREGNTHEGSVTREEQEVKVGKYSTKITGDNFNFSQNLSNLEDYKGKNISCFVWIKTEVPNKYRIQIYDGVKSNFSKRHWGGGNWELLQATHKIDPSAEFVTIRVIQAANTGGVDDVVCVDGALLVEGYWNTFYQYKLHMEKGE